MARDGGRHSSSDPQQERQDSRSRQSWQITLSQRITTDDTIRGGLSEQ